MPKRVIQLSDVQAKNARPLEEERLQAIRWAPAFTFSYQRRAANTGISNTRFHGEAQESPSSGLQPEISLAEARERSVRKPGKQIAHGIQLARRPQGHEAGRDRRN